MTELEDIRVSEIATGANTNVTTAIVCISKYGWTNHQFERLTPQDTVLCTVFFPHNGQMFMVDSRPCPPASAHLSVQYLIPIIKRCCTPSLLTFIYSDLPPLGFRLSDSELGEIKNKVGDLTHIHYYFVPKSDKGFETLSGTVAFSRVDKFSF